jgi:hypothetical protein
LGRISKFQNKETNSVHLTPAQALNLMLKLLSNASGILKLVEIENVILDCSNLLSSLCNTKVAYIGRANNMAAHSLVGVARNVGSKSWVGNVPNPTASIVRSEAFFN